MNTFWNILTGAGMMAGFSFIAGLLLCLPGLFSKTALGRRHRLPLPERDATAPRRPPVRGPAGWRRILTCIVAAPFSAFLFIIVVPALFAMALAAIGTSYRFYRHLAYRALRQKRRACAFPISFPVGLIISARARQPHAL